MRKLLQNERGQASVEYLLVGLVLIAMMGALAALWHYASSGGFSLLIESSASHSMEATGGWCDALLF